MGNRSEAQKLLDESILMNEMTITQVVHPDRGEIVFIKEEFHKDDDGINSGEKLKMIEMAKIQITMEIMAGFESTE